MTDVLAISGALSSILDTLGSLTDLQQRRTVAALMGLFGQR